MDMYATTEHSELNYLLDVRIAGEMDQNSRTILFCGRLTRNGGQSNASHRKRYCEGSLQPDSWRHHRSGALQMKRRHMTVWFCYPLWPGIGIMASMSSLEWNAHDRWQ